VRLGLQGYADFIDSNISNASNMAVEESDLNISDA
jgi:hypothetical protein